MFALFCECAARPPACVAVELFLDSSGQESVAEKLATEGSFVALLSEEESLVTTVEEDSPQFTEEYHLGTREGEWKGDSSLVTPAEERERSAANTTLSPPEDISKLFERSMSLQPAHTSVLSEQASDVSSVGQGSGDEGKVKKGVFGRFVSALQATQPLTLESSPFHT